MPTIGEISVQLSEPIKETYYFIVNYAYDHCGTVPSLRSIARMTGVPWQTIVYHIRRLCKLGLLRKNGRGAGMSYEIAGGCFEVDFHSQPFVNPSDIEIGEEDEIVYVIE